MVFQALIGKQTGSVQSRHLARLRDPLSSSVQGQAMYRH